MFGNGEAIVTPVALPRNGLNKAGGLDSRHRANLLQQSGVEVDQLSRFTVAPAKEVESHGEHILCVAAHIGGAETRIALEQQPGRDQQHHGQADLHGQQRTAQPGVRLPAA